MTYFTELEDISTTQVIAKGMTLNAVLKEDFLEELKKKLGEAYTDIVVSDLRIMLLPKEKKPKIDKEGKGIIIELGGVDFIRLEQPSPNHYKDKVIVITANRKDNLDKMLK